MLGFYKKKPRRKKLIKKKKKFKLSMAFSSKRNAH